MLTAKDEVSDRITGLNTGADDYLVKPFDFVELLARIKAILRRQRRMRGGENAADGNESQLLQFGDLRLNMATREVTRSGRLIELTATEYNLLHLFMSHPRQVLDRQTILNRVWGYDFLGETNIIEVYVRYLREKIEDSPSAPRLNSNCPWRWLCTQGLVQSRIILREAFLRAAVLHMDFLQGAGKMSAKPPGQTLEKTRDMATNMAPPTLTRGQQAHKSLAFAWRQRLLSGLRWQLTLMYSTLLGIFLLVLSILAYFTIGAGTARGDVQVIILIATIALIVVGVGLVFLLTNMLLRPLRRLSDAAQAIALGDLQQRNRITPLMNNDDEVSKTAASLNEIVGQLERAALVQQEGDARFRRLFSDASHQLRTPLTSLRGFTESTDAQPPGRCRNPATSVAPHEK